MMLNNRLNKFELPLVLHVVRTDYPEGSIYRYFDTPGEAEAFIGIEGQRKTVNKMTYLQGLVNWREQ